MVKRKKNRVLRGRSINDGFIRSLLTLVVQGPPPPLPCFLERVSLEISIETIVKCARWKIWWAPRVRFPSFTVSSVFVEKTKKLVNNKHFAYTRSSHDYTRIINDGQFSGVFRRVWNSRIGFLAAFYEFAILQYYNFRCWIRLVLHLYVIKDSAVCFLNWMFII